VREKACSVSCAGLFLGVFVFFSVHLIAARTPSLTLSARLKAQKRSFRFVCEKSDQ
jgi:hypothetical protein